MIRLTTRVIMVTVMAATVFTGCSSGDQQGEVPKQVVETEASDSTVITLVAEDSVTALDLLKSEHEVNTHSTAMGTFVQGIDALESGEGMFWLYSVNGEMPDLAADKQMVGPGDTVRWHFRRAAE